MTDEILVVDSFSTDQTVAIATECGARVLQHPFVNQGAQFQWALDNAKTDADWIMKLDADEVVGSDLAERLEQILPSLPQDVAGIRLKQRRIFMERWIKHGGIYPLTLLRIWRNGCGRIEQRWMDEHIIIDGGRIVTVSGDFSDHNTNDLTFFVEKHNRYASREAVEVLNKKYNFLDSGSGSIAASSSGSQAAIRRWMKEHVYNLLPFWIGPLAYFVYRYIFLLGFLDGREGAIYHVLQGFWYRFLVGAKVFEYERALSGIEDPNAKRNELARLTGLPL
jgi:glycosyltransferase involved in cell wall biosynthesis